MQCHSRTRILIAGLVAILALLPLSPLPAEALLSGRIEISAEAPPRAPEITAGSTLIDATAIAASGAATLGEAISVAPGVDVEAKGGAGSQSVLSIRGSSTNQVLVLVDGSPASDPSTGQTDLATLGLSSSDIESIEVLRGGASARYGADAIGGVVLVTTRKAGKPSLEVSLSNLVRLPFASVEGYGLAAVTKSPDPLVLVDGQELALRLALPQGLILSAAFERAGNDYSFTDSSGEVRARNNAGLMGGRARVSWSGTLWGAAASASLEGDARRLGIPGSITAPTPEAVEEDGNGRFKCSWATDSFFSDHVGFTTLAYASLKSFVYRETQAASSDGSEAGRLGLDASWSWLAMPGTAVGFGFSSRYERLQSSSILTLSGSVPERLSGGVWIEPRVSTGDWDLVPTARVDLTSDFPSGFSFSFAAARRIGGGLTLSAKASTAYRAPSFDDLYWPADKGVAGNPGLRPETSYGLDLGLELGSASPGSPGTASRGSGLTATATAFARYAQDVILWQPGDDGVWRPSNWGRALYPGLEATLRTELGAVGVTLSATLIHSIVMSGSIDLADDRRVPMLPEAAFTLALSRDFGPFSTGLSLDYAGLRYLGTDNRAYLPSRLVADAHLRVRGSGPLAFTIDATNLLGERYQEVLGYPVPGFSLRLTATLRLGGEAAKSR
ncbi:MAG: TonB-dependent receptor plug domain-containing protein [Rectinemataceae bacterium]